MLDALVLFAALGVICVAVVCVIATEEDPQWPPVHPDPEPEGGPDLIDWCRDHPDRIHAPDTLEDP